MEMKALFQASKEELFKSPYRWLIISMGGDLAVLEKLSLLIDSDVVVARRMDELSFLFIEGKTFGKDVNYLKNQEETKTIIT